MWKNSKTRPDPWESCTARSIELHVDLIGDPKQAIYAVRRADVFSFWRRTAGRQGQESEGNGAATKRGEALDVMVTPLR